MGPAQSLEGGAAQREASRQLRLEIWTLVEVATQRGVEPHQARTCIAEFFGHPDRRRAAQVICAGLEGQSQQAHGDAIQIRSAAAGFEPHDAAGFVHGTRDFGHDAVELLLVHGDDAFEQVEDVAGVTRDSHQRPGVLGQARASPARTRLQVRGADAMIGAHSFKHSVDICIDGLAHRRQRVHERDLGRKEGVRCVLDRLRRGGIAQDQRCVDAVIERRYPLRDRAVLRTDDDPVRRQEICHCGAFPQELRIGRQRDIGASECGADLRCGAHGHRGLGDDHGTGPQVRRDRIDR